MLITAPTRYFAYRADGRRYSLTAAADFLAEAGFGGADLSLDTLPELEGLDGDEGWKSVLYGFGNRAAARGLGLPLCHLPFAMPSPDDAYAMARFARTQEAGLRAAAMVGIPRAVIHPIVRHESRRCRGSWLTENLDYLTPLRDLAGRLGVTLCIENMTGRPYATHPAEAVYGSHAAHILELSQRLDTPLCWDFGHANLTGLCQSVQLETLRGRVALTHIHDNDGESDSHLIPGEAPTAGAVDWADAAEGLRLSDYLTRRGNTPAVLDFEVKSSHLPADYDLRLAHAARLMASARRFAALL